MGQLNPKTTKIKSGIIYNTSVKSVKGEIRPLSKKRYSLQEYSKVDKSLNPMRSQSIIEKPPKFMEMSESIAYLDHDLS